MMWQEALEIVVARTRHERYRELCSDDNPDAEQRDAYRTGVIEMAESVEPKRQRQRHAPYTPAATTDPSRPTVAQSTSLLKQMKSCPFRSTNSSCGCQGAWCSLKADASGRRPSIVGHQDCFSCIREYPN